MADITVSLDQLDAAGICILQAKAIADLAAKLPPDGEYPDDALPNAMWAIKDLLNRATAALHANPATGEA